MSKRKYNVEQDDDFNKRLEEEFAEEKDIIEAQALFNNNPKNFHMRSCKFSNIHAMIREARLVNGYTQHRLSAALGINRSTYSRYENGKIQIPSEVIDNIFELLNIEMIIATNAKEVIIEKQIAEWEEAFKDINMD